MGEAEPLEDHEGAEAGDEVEEPRYEGVAQDVGQGGGHLRLLFAQFLQQNGQSNENFYHH